MADAKKCLPDPLVRDYAFPESGELFKFAPVDLKEALKDGIVAVDTNVLLVPYNTGQASLQQIRRVYERLTKENRLRIPGQVAREFASNRAEKLKILFQQLSQKRNVNLNTDTYPLLEGIDEYAALEKSEKEIVGSLKKYRELIGSLLEKIKAWHWDDPVSNIYREFFAAALVINPEIDREKLLKDSEYRQENRIPPGYKDASNEHSGIGDLLIWQTLLAIGATEHRHLVFVSGEEKTDWWYRSENQSLYPRFELIDEYRRASGGKSLLMISFAELLKQYGAPETVVDEVKQEEAVSTAEQLEHAASELSSVRASLEQRLAEEAIFRWLRKRFPGQAIERHSQTGLDFVVASDSNDPIGLEVKYVPRGGSSATQRSFANWLLYLAVLRNSNPDIRMYAVLVGPRENVLAALPEIINISGMLAVVGTLSDRGEFSPLIDPFLK